MSPATSKPGTQKNLWIGRSHSFQLAPEDELLLCYFRSDYEALIRFYAKPSSYAQCARHFGLPEGTVKSRLHRALRRLNKLAGKPIEDRRHLRSTMMKTPQEMEQDD